MIAGLKVGVVIPAYDEAASLERLLSRILGERCDLVILVNDGSSDATSVIGGATFAPYCC